MKKIVRLTESDLARIVKRVIKENNKNLIREGNGQNAIDAITKAMEWTFKEGGTNERNVLKGVQMIKNKTDYMEALAAVKKLGHNTIGSYISTDMEEVMANYNLFGYADESNRIIGEIESHLKKFNPKEDIVLSVPTGGSHGRNTTKSSKKPFQGLN